MTNDSAFNRGQIAPGNPYPERATTEYQKVFAENTKRSGPMQAEERLAARPRISGGMITGFNDGTQRPQTFETKIADGRGPAGYLPAPTWAAVDAATLRGMSEGTSGSGQQRYESVIAPPNGGRRRNPADSTGV